MEDIIYLGLLDDDALELDVAALQISALDHPGVDLEPYVDLLGTISEELTAIAGETRSAPEQAAALATVLAGTHGFAGDRTTYDDPANTDLIRVLDRRRGLPVSLSILYVAAARRIDWTADALDTPGHVLIRVGDAPGGLILDPFDSGAIVDGGEPDGGVGSAMSNRATLVRLLANEATRADAGGDRVRARTVYTRMTTIAPGHASGWWERARLELAADDRVAARASLSAMLEVTRDPPLRERVTAMLSVLATPR